MNTQEFQAIITGKKKGISASMARGLFRVIACFYSGGVRLNNALYDGGFKQVHSLSVPVISVGNITLGGTGKTPMTAYLTQFYLHSGHRPAFLSRGYKASHLPLSGAPSFASSLGSSEYSAIRPYLRPNDEAAELAEQFPELPHFQNPNRYQAGKVLLQAFPQTDRLILDDGFQHRSLRRDTDIILLDSLNPFGEKRIFPAGFLREPLTALKRADAVLLSRADLISETRRQEIRDGVRRYAPKAVWGETAQVPVELIQFCPSKRENQPDSFSNLSWQAFFSSRPVLKEVPQTFLPFCGLGNPKSFFEMLCRQGIIFNNTLVFPDHHSFQETDFSRLIQEGKRQKVSAFLTTMKDLVKIRRSFLGDIPLYAVKIGIRFLSGEEEFLKILP